jgi:hypothetical protein
MEARLAEIVVATWLAAASVAPAAAQTMVTTISGTVGANTEPGPDIDTLGLFGQVGANLNGLPMRMTSKFAASQMNEGGQANGYSAWSGPSGTCAVTIGGVHAKPSVQKLTGMDNNRIYFYSDYQGTWALYQDVENANMPDTCGIAVASGTNPFVPSAALVQSFAYKPPKTEQINDQIVLDITVNGVREAVTADVKSVTYGP